MKNHSNNIQRINNVWNEVNAYISKESIEVDQVSIEKQLSCLFFPGKSFNWIFDFHSRKFEYVSPNITEMVGFNPNEFGVAEIISIIHPEDIDYVFECLDLISKFFTKYASSEERVFYKTSFHYRVKHISGKYHEFLDQQIVLSENKKGKLSKILVNLSDISGFVQNGEKSKLSFIDLRGIKSYYYVQSEQDFKRIYQKKSNLTSRELDVIRLISEGYNNLQIGNLLFVSPATVKKHRTNILQKTGLQKMALVLNYAIKEGLI